MKKAGPRARFWFYAKIFLGISLLGVLVVGADLRTVLTKLAAIDLRFAVLVFVLPHIGIWLSTLKWQFLLRELGVRAPLGRLLNLYLIGTFFNNFFPTMVGGDTVRIYQLSRDSGKGAAVTAATFMERFIGLAALVTLLPLSLLLETISRDVPQLGVVVGVAMGCFALAFYLVFSDLSVPLPEIFTRLPGWERMAGLVQQFRNELHLFSKSRLVLSVGYLLSIFFYLVTAASSWAATQSTGTSIGFLYILSVVPLILLAALIPISFNGLGITEFGYVFFLGLAGVPMADALTAALLLRFRLILTALLGGLLFLVQKTHSSSIGMTEMAIPSDQKPVKAKEQ